LENQSVEKTGYCCRMDPRSGCGPARDGLPSRKSGGSAEERLSIIYPEYEIEPGYTTVTVIHVDWIIHD